MAEATPVNAPPPPTLGSLVSDVTMHLARSNAEICSNASKAAFRLAASAPGARDLAHAYADGFCSVPLRTTAVCGAVGAAGGALCAGLKGAVIGGVLGAVTPGAIMGTLEAFDKFSDHQHLLSVGPLMKAAVEAAEEIAALASRDEFSDHRDSLQITRAIKAIPIHARCTGQLELYLKWRLAEAARLVLIRCLARTPFSQNGYSINEKYGKKGSPETWDDVRLDALGPVSLGMMPIGEKLTLYRLYRDAYVNYEIEWYSNTKHVIPGFEFKERTEQDLNFVMIGIDIAHSLVVAANQP